MIMVKSKYIDSVEVYPMFKTIFSVCMTAITIIFPIICVLGIVQFVGFCFAIRDEADMELVFGDKRDGILFLLSCYGLGCVLEKSQGLDGVILI